MVGSTGRGCALPASAPAAAVMNGAAVHRLMRAHGLLAQQRAGRPHGPKAHDGTITTEWVDRMWGTDLTLIMSGY